MLRYIYHMQIVYN